MRWQRQPRELCQRWIDVNKFHNAIGAGTCVLHSWNREQQRYVGVILAVAVFAPCIMFAELPTMVTPKNDDRVFRKTGSLELIENFA